MCLLNEAFDDLLLDELLDVLSCPLLSQFFSCISRSSNYTVKFLFYLRIFSAKHALALGLCFSLLLYLEGPFFLRHFTFLLGISQILSRKLVLLHALDVVYQTKSTHLLHLF